jgi:hypothetical protein
MAMKFKARERGVIDTRALIDRRFVARIAKPAAEGAIEHEKQGTASAGSADDPVDEVIAGTVEWLLTAACVRTRPVCAGSRRSPRTPGPSIALHVRWRHKTAMCSPSTWATRWRTAETRR